MSIDKRKTQIKPENQMAEKSSRVHTITLFVFIIFALLIVMILGTNIYKALSETRSEASNLRLESSLLLNTIRMNDENNALSLSEGPQGDSLVLTEYLDSGTYETRFYEYNGYLVEEYAIQGDKYTPGRASQVCKTDTFSIKLTNNLITIYTDMGETNIAFRSSQVVQGGGN